MDRRGPRPGDPERAGLRCSKAATSPRSRDRMAGPLEFGTAGIRGEVAAGPNRMNRAVDHPHHPWVWPTYLLERNAVAMWTARWWWAATPGSPARRSPPTPSGCWPQPGSRSWHSGAMLRHRWWRMSPSGSGPRLRGGHRQPQPSGGQRVQGLRQQQRPDHPAGGPADRRCDRAGRARRRQCPGSTQASGPHPWWSRSPTTPRAPTSPTSWRPAQRREGVGNTIVYTPLHGVAGEMTRRVMSEAGHTDIAIVPEQAMPDGRFPTVRFPNPEEPGALDLAVALAEGEGRRPHPRQRPGRRPACGGCSRRRRLAAAHRQPGRSAHGRSHPAQRPEARRGRRPSCCRAWCRPHCSARSRPTTVPTGSRRSPGSSGSGTRRWRSRSRGRVDSSSGSRKRSATRWDRWCATRTACRPRSCSPTSPPKPHHRAIDVGPTCGTWRGGTGCGCRHNTLSPARGRKGAPRSAGQSIGWLPPRRKASAG